MSAKSGKLVLLSVKDGATYVPIMSARSNSFSINRTQIDTSTKEDGGWTATLAGGGVTTIETTVSGIFKNSAADKKLRALGISGDSFEGKITLSNGDEFAGNFVITSMEFGGEYDNAETYSASIVNDGEITFTEFVVTP